MADRASETASSSASTSRTKKRQRQKTNQHRRAIAHDALIAFHEHPSFGAAFRAWLAYIDEHLPHEYRSAVKFTRALRSFSSRGSGEPDYPETARISADTFAQWVDDLAWSLNVKFTLKENAGNLRTPTSRIGSNFRSLVYFLARAHALTQADFTYLLDECKALEEDLDRTARVNRIMEEYAWYIQEAYFDTKRTVDETYYGEYEVERISGKRILVLRRYDPEEESDTSSTSLRSFTTYFPSPLVNHVRRGDTMTLQICHLEQSKVWVPYMYSGFTPSREDGGNATPTERQVRANTGRHMDDAVAALQSSLMRLEVAPRQRSTDRIGRHARSRTPQRHGSAANSPPSQAPGFDFNFDESKFTEAFFRQWDGDIDTDEDFADIVRPPDDGECTAGNEGGVNLYHTLKDRHS
ncbi:hypothetical protein DFH11DRAFT_1724570 [Phellopilus nigrolimitatus]|nr:hypothetical protein DFH11DRAFT_1724570 [Phellopilus nigrolimitatus]